MIPNPFVGPRPLIKGNPIFGRDREIAELRHLITAERLVLLHSPSGAGKSSLINAGLIPELKDRFDIWDPTRVHQDPPPNTPNRYVWSTINGWKKSGEETNLKAFVAKNRGSNNPLLIFDQFEEIIRADPADSFGRSEYFRQLAELLSDPSIWALFVVREDFLAPLLPLFAILPTHIRTRYRLDFLNTDQATLAIDETAQSVRRKLHPKAVGTLVRNLAAIRVQNPDGSYSEESVDGAYVEPLQLQVVCRHLWPKLPNADQHFDPAEFGKLTGIDDALAAYYNESIKKLAKDAKFPERAIRDWFQAELITAAGSRGQVQREGEYSRGLANTIIEKLVNTYLVRAEERRKFTWYELSHDRLIKPVLSSNAAWHNSNLHETQRMADEWHKKDKLEGLLLTGEKLVAAERWADQNAVFVTTEDREYIDASIALRKAAEKEQAHERRVRLWLRVALVTAGIAIVAAIVAWWQYMSADRHMRVAEEQGRVARVSMARISVQEAINAVDEHREDLALAHFARAIRFDPLSPIASGWAADLLDRSPWWFPRPDLKLGSPIRFAKIDEGGRRLLIASEDGAVQLFDAATGAPLGKPLPLPSRLQFAVFSTNGIRLVTISQDNIARVWDTASGAQTVKPMPHTAAVAQAFFSQDAQRLLTVAANTALLWDLSYGDPAAKTLPHTDPILTAALSPDGRSVVTASDRKAILWDASAEPIAKPLPQQHLVLAAAFSPAGSRFATASGDTVQLWDTATAKPAKNANPLSHQEPVTHLSFRPDGLRLLAASRDDGVHVWNLETGQPVFPPMTHDRFPHTAFFSPDGERIATVTEDGSVHIWDASSGLPLATPLANVQPGTVAFSSDPGHRPVALVRTEKASLWYFTELNERKLEHQGVVWTAAFSPNSQHVLTASADYSAKVWSVADGSAAFRFPHDAAVQDAVFSPNGDRIATASADGFARVWNAASGQLIARLECKSSLWTIAFSPDGKLLAAGAEDGAAFLWDLSATSESKFKRLPNGAAVNSVAFSPNGLQVVTASSDNFARVWDAHAGTLLGKPFAHKNVVYSARFSPDSLRVLTASKDSTAQVWDTAKSQSIRTFQHNDTVWDAVWSLDGKQVLTASADGAARIWNAETGASIGKPMEHAGKAWVRRAVYSPDHRRIVTASRDKSAQIWDAATGAKIGRPLTHAGFVESAVFSPDGRHVLTASKDGTARLWNVAGTLDDTGDTALLAEAVAGLKIDDDGNPVAVPLTTVFETIDKLKPKSGTLPPFIRRFLQR